MDASELPLLPARVFLTDALSQLGLYITSPDSSTARPNIPVFIISGIRLISSEVHLTFAHDLSIALPTYYAKGSAKEEIQFGARTQALGLILVFQSPEEADSLALGLSALVHPKTKLMLRSKGRNAVSIPGRGARGYNAYVDFFERRDVWSLPRILDVQTGKEYILLKLLGRGSFGDVKLALGVSEERFFAVKTITKSALRKLKRTGIFNRGTANNSTSNAKESSLLEENPEIRTMTRLGKHPNITRLTHAFDDTALDALFLVIEFVPEGALMPVSSHKLQGAEPISESEARKIFTGILNGIQYMHSKGIVHRDLKPTNILRDACGTAKLSDFGSAICYDDEMFPVTNSNPTTAAATSTKPYHRPIMSSPFRTGNETTTSSKAVGGTPAFLAPECCLSEFAPAAPDTLYASDIWSLGATLFYMLYGQVPFRGQTGTVVRDMYRAICCDELIFPEEPSVSKEAKEILRGMLEKNPGNRMKLDAIRASAWMLKATVE